MPGTPQQQQVDQVQLPEAVDLGVVVVAVVGRVDVLVHDGGRQQVPQAIFYRPVGGVRRRGLRAVEFGHDLLFGQGTLSGQAMQLTDDRRFPVYPADFQQFSHLFR